VQSEFQEQGRGERGNVWVSQEGKNLLFSILLNNSELKIEGQFVINQLISLSIVEVLKQFYPKIYIKWPNDILADNKKLGGILIENFIKGNLITQSVIGVGLNINQIDFPTLDRVPISLSQLTGQVYDRGKLLQNILKRFMLYFDKEISINTQSIHEKYLNNLVGYGITMDYQLPSGVIFQAKILEVNKLGYLVLENKKGEQMMFEKKQIQLIY
jgi:BirA family biotin operon repressor/biotin-[acetyl-CoA-carboxylase] ligase